MASTYPDIITLWKVSYPDGQAVYVDVGVLVAVRYGSKKEEIITRQGKEPKISKLAIYFDSAITEIKEDDQIKIGDFEGEAFGDSDPEPDRILALSLVPSGTTMQRALV